MRLRRSSARPGSPEELVALYASAKADARVLFGRGEERRRYVNAVLADHGTDAVEAIRARRLLRGRR